MDRMKPSNGIHDEGLGRKLRAVFALSAACLFGSQSVAAAGLPQSFSAVCVESPAANSHQGSDLFRFSFQYLPGQKTLCLMWACGESLSFNSEYFEFLCDNRYVEKPKCHRDEKTDKLVLYDGPPFFPSYFFFEHFVLLPNGQFTLEYERTTPAKERYIMPIGTEKGVARGTCTIGPPKP
jgi:hypothetical protein